MHRDTSFLGKQIDNVDTPKTNRGRLAVARVQDPLPRAGAGQPRDDAWETWDRISSRLHEKQSTPHEQFAWFLGRLTLPDSRAFRHLPQLLESWYPQSRAGSSSLFWMAGREVETERTREERVVLIR